MKPIYLSISGLHSFREKQEIDFQKLCEGGVFGIFGPTGSGKSSILDAMTLALYGKVERALNNTQGIMNHSTDEIHVSFTFELGNASGSKRYRVDRSFKRNGEIKIRTTLSRFIELGEETFVLADKAQDVLEKVESMLGLTHEDFTRAVVLPQGRFAEFLTLKGTDRRQMLQRIFNLEQYGDRLNQRLRDKLIYLKSEEDKLQAEQQGLGEASLEQVETARQRKLEIEKILTDLEHQKQEVEQDFQEKQKLWQWQIERNEMMKEYTKLQLKEQEIRTLEQSWERSAQANQLKPFLEALEEASQQEIYWQKQSELVQQKVNESRLQEKEQAEKVSNFLAEKERVVPELIERQTQLRGAQEILLEMKGLEKESALLQPAIIEQQELIVKLKQEQTKLEEELKQAYELQQKLKQELAGYTISVKDRNLVQLAVRDKQQILALDERRKNKLQEVQEKEQSLQELDHRKKKLALDFLGQAKAHRQCLKAYADFLELISTLYHLLESKMTEVGHEYQALKRRFDYEKEKQLASRLRETLQHGEPCPVCGSTEHELRGPLEPSEDLDIKSLMTNIESKEQLLQEGKQALLLLQSLKNAVHSHSAELAEWQFPEMSKELNGSLIELDQGFEEIAVTTENRGTLPGNSSLLELIEQSSFIQEKVMRIQQTTKQVHKEFQTTLQGWNENATRTELLTQELEELCSKLKEWEQETNCLKNEWNERYSDLVYEQVEEKQQEMDKKDEAAEKWRQRIEKSISYIESREVKNRENRETLQQVELSLMEKNSLLREKNELLKRQRKLMEEKVGSFDVETLLQDISHQLQQWKINEQTETMRLNMLKETVQQFEKEESVAVESLRQALERKILAEKKWSESIAESSFLTVVEVKEHMTSNEELKIWRNEIDHFRAEERKWIQELNRIESLLNGKTLSAIEWEEVQQKRSQIQDQLIEMNQEHGAVSTILMELEKKHNRYQELENQRNKVSDQIEKHGKLQKVLKGNAFVEYVAQEQLIRVCRDASYRLGMLTRHRYALEVDSSGGFVIRDDANGGVKRPVATLSGGETFLTSLSLALALSAQIQLRGEYPLEFFFLDEGFGTLDPELLDTVITALEQLQQERLAVGVISHVPELRERLPRKLIVHPAEPSGRGSRVELETI